MTDDDLYLFNEGTHLRIYEKLGAHPAAFKGAPGVFFAVFAPNARSVSVMGDWNGWNKGAEPLEPRGQSGIWEGFVAGVAPGAAYKYHIVSRLDGYSVDKADPYAFAAEPPPRTGSIVAELDFPWGDGEWMTDRARRHRPDAAVSVYEVHLGSWRRRPSRACS